MPNKPWKSFEREAAELIRGKRFWSNSGEACDIEGPFAVGQCKLVKTLSLNALADLAETSEKQGAQRFKAGVVIVKPRRGKGRSSPTLVVMTAATWRQLHGSSQ
jgi:hypothetical protein